MQSHISVQQAFSDHIKELQRRLFWSLGMLLISSVIGYVIHDTLLDYLIRPLHLPLYYTSPVGGFDVVFRVSLLFGFITAMPVIVYHILCFLEPALPENIDTFISNLIFLSWVLMIAGICVAYFISLPAALLFLKEFSSDQIKPLISTNDYFTFILRYIIGFALLFQLPVCMLFLNRFIQLHPKILVEYLRYIVVFSFIIAAVITPTPDIINQTIMALPIIMLYILSIAVVWVDNKRRSQLVLVSASEY